MKKEEKLIEERKKHTWANEKKFNGIMGTEGKKMGKTGKLGTTGKIGLR